MKTLGSALSIALLTIFILGFFACDKDDDNTPSPVPDARDKFTGNWKVNESCRKIIYYVNIARDPSNPARVLLQNFGDSDAGDPDTAIVAGNSIVLFKQLNTEGWQIEGNGNYKNDESIEWSYSLLISGTQDNCTATYTRN
jgi:hypothetical protein